MERTSHKHNPRLDDELKHDAEPLVRSGAESHVEEEREQEPPANYEPEARYRVDEDAWGRLGPDPVAARRELSRHLPNAFPGSRDDLLSSAREADAPQEVLDVLERLPAGRRFENLYAAWEALFGPIEEDREAPQR